MNALELIKYLESDASLTNACAEAAEMLRRQHEAIKQLRTALDHAKDYSPIGGEAFEAAKKALADTEEMQ